MTEVFVEEPISLITESYKIFWERNEILVIQDPLRLLLRNRRPLLLSFAEWLGLQFSELR